MPLLARMNFIASGLLFEFREMQIHIARRAVWPDKPPTELAPPFYDASDKAAELRGHATNPPMGRYCASAVPVRPATRRSL